MGAVAASLLGLGTLALLLPGPFPLTGTTATVAGAVTEQALLSAAGLAVWALLGWHLLILTTALLGRLPGRTGRGCRTLLRRLAPWTASRVVAAAVGLTLLSGTSACAAGLAPGGDGAGSTTESGSTSIADTGSPQDPSAAADSGRVIASMSIDWPATGSAVVTAPAQAAPARVPPAQTAPAQPARAPVPAPAPSGETDLPASDSLVGTGPVTVRAGDSLWAIAHRFLPPAATDAETDIAWRAWYVANSESIGDDPDLIRPGQLLLPPTFGTG